MDDELKTSFGRLRRSFIDTRNLIQSTKKTTKEKEIELNKTFQKDKALVRGEILRDEARKRIADYKDAMRKDVQIWFDDKQSDILAGLMVPPSKEIESLLDIYSRRSNASEKEIGILLKKCNGNYQALKLVSEIAKRNGFDVHLNADFDEEMEALEATKLKLDNIVDELSAEENALSYYAVSMLGTSDLDSETHPFHGAYTLDFSETWKPEYTKFEKLHDEIEDDVRAGDFDTASKKALKLNHGLKEEAKKGASENE